MQTPDVADVANIGTLLFGHDGDGEECNHPDQFKQTQDAILNHDGSFFLQGDMSWLIAAHGDGDRDGDGDAAGDVSSYSNYHQHQHQGSLDQGCFHTPEEAAQLRDFLAGRGVAMTATMFDAGNVKRESLS